jgi:hypothetical protein
MFIAPLRCRMLAHGSLVIHELPTSAHAYETTTGGRKGAPLDKRVTASIGRTRAAVNAVFMNHIE